MQSGPAGYPDSPAELRRYEALLEMADLVVQHGSLPDLFHELAVRLQGVADFQFLNFSVHNPQQKVMSMQWWEGEHAAVSPMDLPVPESASGWVWEHQEDLLFPNLREETRFPRVLDVLRAKGINTYYVIPLTAAEKRLGALGVASVLPDAYGEQDRRLLRRVAELVAVAVENTLIREAMHGGKQRLRALVDVNRTLASSLEMQHLLPLISECVSQVVPHDFAGITLFEGDQEDLKAYVLSPALPTAVVESGRSVSLNGDPVGASLSGAGIEDALARRSGQPPQQHCWPDIARGNSHRSVCAAADLQWHPGNTQRGQQKGLRFFSGG